MTTTPASRTSLAIMAGSPCEKLCCPTGANPSTKTIFRRLWMSLRSDWLTTGPKVPEFEEAFAARVGAKHAVSFSSGTAALHARCFRRRIESRG